MPRGWQWDATLYRGSARYYERGRLPYPRGLAGALATALSLDGRGRLLDVGCGPGIVALRLAHLFAEVVGLDADRDMLAEAGRRAAEIGITSTRWVHALAENLPLDVGAFRVATFAASFHWMERDQVAAAIFSVLEPGGAFVQVSTRWEGVPAAPDQPLPHPPPPREAMAALVRRYLGPVRRAGQGVLLHGTPGGEAEVVSRAGFEDAEIVRVPGGELKIRSVDELIAARYSDSASAPHLFGDRLSEFEAELRALLARTSPSGLFMEQTDDAELRIWRKPAMAVSIAREGPPR